jgi:hypothetical protein
MFGLVPNLLHVGLRSPYIQIHTVPPVPEGVPVRSANGLLVLSRCTARAAQQHDLTGDLECRRRLGRFSERREAGTPARMLWSPATLALSFGIRRATHLGHHDNRQLATEEPPQPRRHMARWLAPMLAASTGSHSATGAGSSSTML